MPNTWTRKQILPLESSMSVCLVHCCVPSTELGTVRHALTVCFLGGQVHGRRRDYEYPERIKEDFLEGKSKLSPKG